MPETESTSLIGFITSYKPTRIEHIDLYFCYRPSFVIANESLAMAKCIAMDEDKRAE